MARVPPASRWSPQYTSYIRGGRWPPTWRIGGRCPSCHKRVKGIVLAHGRRVEGLTRFLNPSFGLLDADTVMRCPICDAEWPVLRQTVADREFTSA